MAQRQIKVAFDATTQRLTWNMEGAEPLALDIEGLTAEVRARALMFGLTQTVSDAGALKAGSTVAEKRAAMAKRIETLLSGKWSADRQAPSFNVGDVVTALARVKFNGSVDAANEAINRYAAKHEIGREASAKLFAGDAAIATEITRIVAARRPVKFDADAALAEMEAETAEEEASEDPELVE